MKTFCDENNIRFIQISTDCVFTGKKGNYSEKDKPDSLDLYGHSKILGEINEKNHLTLRTSTIGFEKYSKRGLLEWFLSQKNECYGYKKAYFVLLSWCTKSLFSYSFTYNYFEAHRIASVSQCLGFYNIIHFITKPSRYKEPSNKTHTHITPHNPP